VKELVHQLKDVSSQNDKLRYQVRNPQFVRFIVSRFYSIVNDDE
jgi:hypothetical protein